ncbi:hypothetical protein [Mycobacterium sp.]|uniref:hypothetical protein n=1 Tax=Mycobacterium sp. TaxID=1785 RepID=UPI003F80E4B5
MPNTKRGATAVSPRTGSTPVQGAPVVGGELPGFAGFRGLTHLDQLNAGTGIYSNTQFSLEPPDQALCVGGKFVLEGVNEAFRVFTTGGSPVTKPIAYSQFFGIPPEIVRTNPPTFGPFISDPKCYFDPATHHWFMTQLMFGVDQTSGAFGPPSDLLVAVSKTSNPTGAWWLYKVITTDDGTDGTPVHSGCPCFGDQPLIGADKNGFYVSTNEYGITSTAYHGSQLYAFSKAGLESGANGNVVHIDAAQMTTSLPNGGLAVSVQPATSPTAGQWVGAKNGTEYFASVTDWSVGPALGQGSDRILAWAMTNTKSLNTSSPAPHLAFRVVHSEFYTQPPNATQKDGPHPLGTSLGDPLNMIATNDDRMNQVVFADGNLWSGVNTSVTQGGGSPLSGIAYFIVHPSVTGGGFSASMAAQGYLSARGAHIYFPSIGVTARGRAVMAFSLSGKHFFPSAAYAPIRHGHAGPIYIAGKGKLPSDGFTGYKAEGGNGVARWGDYSAAVADPAGRIWMGAEYIPRAPRSQLANWGTFVWHVHP